MDEQALEEATKAFYFSTGRRIDEHVWMELDEGFKETYRRMVRAAIARYLECQWRPMEEAPRDGTWIEAWRRHAVRPIDVKFNSVYGWFEDDHGNHVYDLLAWRHFPAPPGDKHEG